MANQGIYREAGGASGLPFPRSNLTLLTVVVGLLALAAVAMPPLLLLVVGGSIPGAWRLFREGGGSMWLILLCGLVAPLVTAGLGALVLRGRRVPAAVLFAVAGLPLAVAMLGGFLGQRMVLRAVSGESVDPEQKARIVAEGIAESMATDVFGAFVVCGTAIVAAAAAAFAVASIDRNAASRGGPAPSSSGAIGAAAAGAVWVVASLVVSVMRMRAAGGLIMLTVLPVLVLASLAVAAGRGASTLRGWHDREEASGAAGAIVIAGLSALLAVLALQRGLEASFTARALGAISGEAVDDSQRARILASALDAGRLAPVTYALHAVLGIATFGLALAPALGNGRSPATPGVLVTALVGLALLGGALGLARTRTAAPRMLITTRGDLGTSGVTLPAVVDMFSHRGVSPRYDSERLIIRSDGSGSSLTGMGVPSDTSQAPSCIVTRNITVFADRASTLAMLRKRVGTPSAPSCPKSLVIVARREHPPGLDAQLGDFAGFLGTTEYFAASMDDDPDGPPRRGTAMRVTMVADDALEIDGVRVGLPLSPDVRPTAIGSRVPVIKYVFRPTDTMDRIVSTIFAVENAYGGRIDGYELERQIDDGVRPPPPAPSGRTLIAPVGVTVNGRLPPEVIQRIARQNFGRFRLCYENGLRTDPTLHGRVAVKFVIDRSGAVATAQDSGSDLADRGVVSCIVRGFESLSFPQPEGGIVTVLYPIDLKPAK